MDRLAKALLCASFVVLLGAAVGGCAGPSAPQQGAELSKAGAMPPQAAQSMVAVGKSTKADVEAALGKAATVQFDSGWDVWAYRWRGKQRTTRGDTELVILFGPDGVVRKTRIRPPYAPNES
jgi:outer membrane protein assembly factor BamE (lipoprotein component of BamABCDE complex)